MITKMKEIWTKEPEWVVLGILFAVCFSVFGFHPFTNAFAFAAIIAGMFDEGY